jgi:hypothetical protein
LTHPANPSHFNPGLEGRTGLKQPRWLYWLFVIGVVTFVTRTVLSSDFRGSGLLYLGVPFLVAVMVHHFLPRFSEERPSKKVLNHFRDATVVMLATSAILFEGFLCVLMFLPIYWFATLIYFLSTVLAERRSGKAKIGIQVAPFFLLLFAVEGIAPQLSVSRDVVIIRSIVVHANIADINAHLQRPIQFGGERNWFIGLFPLPDEAHTGTLEQGDIHKLHFTYRRWFFTNQQQGEMHVRLEKVTPMHIRTEIVRNDSYLSHYLRIDGTEVRMEPLANGNTRVTLSVRYSRLLDPSWYFGPMQKYAVERSADYILSNIITPTAIAGRAGV